MVECFEILVRGLRLDPPGRLPVLRAFLNVPTWLGAVINVVRFTLGTIHETWGSARGFRCEFYLGRKSI